MHGVYQIRFFIIICMFVLYFKRQNQGNVYRIKKFWYQKKTTNQKTFTLETKRSGENIHLCEIFSFLSNI